ncbi:hypothetical protein [Xanthomonas arboricola]|uniref:hypothetical protein n=1 Tax=Xanthomonas arboricola TaxID=56448 RepID=UPI0011B0335F|nr:hypothetical protein [Xanthomonas arboricola]
MLNHLQLISAKKWSPLSNFIEYDDNCRIGGMLYKASEFVYFLVSKYNGSDLGGAGSGNHVASVGICGGEGAARRAFNREVELDDGTFFDVEELGIGLGKGSTYRDIINFARENGKVVQETAAYRIAIDGAFIHRMIETEKWIFYFRSMENCDEELPYAFLGKMSA